MHAALYARVSTEEQKEGRTIDSQVNELERLSQTLSHPIVQRYIDEGWSGSLLSRPALDQLRDDAAKGKFAVVLVTDVDRLSRDVANLAVVKRDLETKGVQLIFQKLPNDNSPLSDFMVNILGSFAEFERAMIRDRTRRGRRYKAQVRQLVIGGIPPYGFRYIRKDRERGVEGRYEIVPDEAKVVRMMFAWVADEGLSQRRVRARLRSLGIPARQGRKWMSSSVHRVLTNETYAGTTYYNKHESVALPGSPANGVRYRTAKPGRRLRDRAEWIPIRLPDELQIVPRDLFERVRAQLQRNREHSPRNVRYFYLLRLVRKTCGRCRASYAGEPVHGKRYYRCSRRDPDEKCRSRSVNAETIEPAVWAAVEQAIQNPALVIEQVRAWQERRQRETTTQALKQEELEEQLAAVEKEEDRVLAAYRQAALTLHQFEKEIAKVNARRAALAELLQIARASPPPLDSDAAPRRVTDWSALVRHRLQALTQDEKQALIGYVLREIVIEDDVIRLRGEIPGCELGQSDTAPTSVKGHGHNTTGRGHTAHTPIEGHGHNVALPFEMVLTLERLHPSRPSAAASSMPLMS